MKHNADRSDDWLDNLDAIIKGDAVPPHEDVELLHVVTRLSSALAPLRAMAQSDATDHPRKHAYQRLPHQHLLTRAGRFAPPRAGVLVAVLVILLCLASMGHAIGVASLWQGTTQAFHMSTSLDQINGVSIASLARPHAGLKPLPLLPAVLPPNTQATTYGVLTDASDPNVMTTFVADYKINGQDVLLYEQPSDVQMLSTTAQTIRIGSRQGQLFNDDAGNHALQWYQNEMLCQLTSRLSVAQLVQIASVFQPIKSWDLVH